MAEQAAQAAPVPQAPQAPRAPMLPPVTRMPEPVSEYAKRPTQGLDVLGRQVPVNKSGDEDQLDIPAFLRRQAN